MLNPNIKNLEFLFEIILLALDAKHDTAPNHTKSNHICNPNIIKIPIIPPIINPLFIPFFSFFSGLATAPIADPAHSKKPDPRLAWRFILALLLLLLLWWQY